jgi:hypothetical protein
MSVTFGSGDFSSTSPDQTTLTSFHLDRTVDLTTNVTVTTCDNGFYIALVLRTPDGGPEVVKTSDVQNPDLGSGTIVSIRFESIPEGYYDLVIASVDGTVAGTFSASWDNSSDD